MCNLSLSESSFAFSSIITLSCFYNNLNPFVLLSFCLSKSVVMRSVWLVMLLFVNGFFVSLQTTQSRTQIKLQSPGIISEIDTSNWIQLCFVAITDFGTTHHSQIQLFIFFKSNRGLKQTEKFNLLNFSLQT